MNTNNVMNAIAALDLEPVKAKLMHVESGEGWSRSKANALDVEYRRFLYLMYAFPEEQTAPTVDVDTFWHYHILDTMKYAADCENTFGFFLHHYPHLGMEGEHDIEAQLRGGERMRELYEQTFGQDYIRAEAYGAKPAQAAFCQRVTSDTKAQGAQTAFCQRVTADVAMQGAQAAFCQRVTAETKAQGAQAAFCQRVTADTKARGAQAAFCQRVTADTKSQGAQVAFCQRGTANMAMQGAQAAFCQRVTADTKAQGAQAAFCQRVTADMAMQGAQAAFCQRITGNQKAPGAQAAFCQRITGNQKAPGAQAAFCQRITGNQKAQGAQGRWTTFAVSQAANDPAAFGSGDSQAQVRPAAAVRPAVSQALAA